MFPEDIPFHVEAKYNRNWMFLGLLLAAVTFLGGEGGGGNYFARSRPRINENSDVEAHRAISLCT